MTPLTLSDHLARLRSGIRDGGTCVHVKVTASGTNEGRGEKIGLVVWHNSHSDPIRPVHLIFITDSHIHIYIIYVGYG